MIMLTYIAGIEGWTDKQKFNKIYEEYGGLMFYVAKRILGTDADAEDAVQTAFLKIAKNIKKISEPVCPKTRGFVVIIVERTAIDMFRKRKRYTMSELKEATAGIAIDYDGDDRLAECITKLPPRYREVILLKYHYGYTLKEIGKMMDLSLAAVTKLDQRAKNKLRKLCEEEGLL